MEYVAANMTKSSSKSIIMVGCNDGMDEEVVGGTALGATDGFLLTGEVDGDVV